MNPMRIFQIGETVFYFDDSLKGDLPIKESTVYGCFVARKTGDLYYYLKEKQVSAFCVAGTQEEAEELRARFIEYRDDYMKRVDEQTERFNIFKLAFNIPSMKDDSVEEIQ